VYLELNAAEEEAFKATADRMGLTNEEVYMEMVTSWERKAAQKTREEIALNLLRRGMIVSEIAQITGLNIEQVQELQAQLSQEN
jgi:hypothetical protein